MERKTKRIKIKANTKNNSIMKKTKTLLIGWDGADWKYLMPLIDQGLMPNLKKLIEGGTMGRLATLDPPISPTLWTSIATGKRPYKHGIHGFTEPNASGDGLHPVYSTSRKCKAIWNIFTQHQLKTHVVGWWPSHPAEPINGVMVSNLYQQAKGKIEDAWPLMNGAVHPASQSDLYAKLRVHPQELTVNHIEPFVPLLNKVDQSQGSKLSKIQSIIANCSSIHSAATYIMANEDWDFMGVYYDGIDHLCHGFMKYHPPHRSHIPIKEYELYKDVVNGGCRYHDMMLGSLMDQVDEDTNIILVSDHGFHPDHNRPKFLPNEPMAPALEHSPYGIIVMNGPNVKKDSSVFGASLLDITPTILSMHDLPVAEDMDGRVLVNAFDKVPEIKTIKSWENIQGTDGSHPKDLEISEESSKAELQQLIDLGYIEDPEEDIEKAIKKTVDENNFHLARAYINGQQWEEGINILEQLHQENPTVLRFATRLCHAYQTNGRLREARKTLSHIRGLLNRESPQLDLTEGTILLHEGRYKKALRLFQKVEDEADEQPNLHLRIANAYLQLNRLEDAKDAIYKELKINPEEAVAYYTLGMIEFHQTHYDIALDAFINATGLLYYYPSAHFYIGECLNALEKYDEAITAYSTCLKLVPNMNIARQRIINLYEGKLDQPGRALHYKLDFDSNIKGTINIVSGLPRSGTSMMMQMLEAGGLEIFSDGARKSDESNPKGYYEHEGVKTIARNKTFLKDAKDKVLKVIAHLLVQLPAFYRYKIVFMERDILEVVASQQKMIERNGGKGRKETLPLPLVQQYEETIKKVKEWAANQPNVEIIFIPHRKAMEVPFEQAMLINDFFEGALQVEQMAAVVDTSLHREKINLKILN